MEKKNKEEEKEKRGEKIKKERGWGLYTSIQI